MSKGVAASIICLLSIVVLGLGALLLAQLGKDGWQLVSARRAQDSKTDSFAYEMILMREKP